MLTPNATPTPTPNPNSNPYLYPHSNPNLNPNLYLYSHSNPNPNLTNNNDYVCVGKTTSILCLARALLGSSMREAVKELNASDDR